MNGWEVATEWFLGLIVLPHGKRRSCHNIYYARTKYAFHGFSARNFWWRNNVGACKDQPQSVPSLHYCPSKCLILCIRFMRLTSKNVFLAHEVEEKSRKNCKMLTFSTFTRLLPRACMFPQSARIIIFGTQSFSQTKNHCFWNFLK